MLSHSEAVGLTMFFLSLILNICSSGHNCLWICCTTNPLCCFPSLVEMSHVRHSEKSWWKDPHIQLFEENTRTRIGKRLSCLKFLVWFCHCHQFNIWKLFHCSNYICQNWKEIKKNFKIWQTEFSNAAGGLHRLCNPRLAGHSDLSTFWQGSACQFASTLTHPFRLWLKREHF